LHVAYRTSSSLRRSTGQSIKVPLANIVNISQIST
jgi:hypothetical protein